MRFQEVLVKSPSIKKLVQVAAASAEASGVPVQVVNLRDYPLPLYDQDFEEEHGIPGQAMQLKELFKAHQGFLIASPEYNSSITPLLKNTIDWVSRPVEGEPPMAAFRGKIASLMSASPGGLGGLRGLVHVRSILSNIGVLVLSNQHAMPKAHECFSAAGQLTDDHHRIKVEGLGKELASFVQKLSADG